MTAFGELLRRHREAGFLSQEELAERAGMSVRGLRALESGWRRRPYPHTLRGLVAALGLSATEAAEFRRAVPPRASGAAAMPAGKPTPRTSQQEGALLVY
jgi:transcriptional regulator with XRE-family HTH domain